MNFAFPLGLMSIITKGMTFGQNKRKFNEKGFYLGNNHIKLTHGYFEPSLKSIDGHHEERSNIWNHMLGSQLSSIQSFRAPNHYMWWPNLKDYFETISLNVSKKGMRMDMITHVEVFLTSYHILLVAFREHTSNQMHLSYSFRFPTMTCPSTLLLVNLSNLNFLNT